MNEYHMIRLTKSVNGVLGTKMKYDDPRRVRYYIRAESEENAVAQMKKRFPNDLSVSIHVTLDVKPLKFAA